MATNISTGVGYTILDSNIFVYWSDGLANENYWAGYLNSFLNVRGLPGGGEDARGWN